MQNWIFIGKHTWLSPQIVVGMGSHLTAKQGLNVACALCEWNIEQGRDLHAGKGAHMYLGVSRLLCLYCQIY